MTKFKFTLFAICPKEYEIEAKDRDEAEEKAMKDFKENIFDGIDEDESYGFYFEEGKE